MRSSARCAMRACRRLPTSSGTTRSAAALDFWVTGSPAPWWRSATRRPRFFRLLELLRWRRAKTRRDLRGPGRFRGRGRIQRGARREFARHALLIVRGRMGGSAMTAAAVNALAKGRTVSHNRTGRPDRRPASGRAIPSW